MVAPHCVRLASRDMVPNYELAPPSLEVVAAPVAHLYLLTCARCSPVTRPLRTCTLRFAPFLTGDARLPERARARAVVALPDSHRRYRYAPLLTVTHRCCAPCREISSAPESSQGRRRSNQGSRRRRRWCARWRTSRLSSASSATWPGAGALIRSIQSNPF